MPASEARIAANRANALKSTGPRTPEGKEASRANSYKHGLTGGGVVMPHREAAEIESRHAAFCEEFGSYSASGQTLARLAATMSVRAERCVTHENAMLAERARAALAGFEAPEGLDASEVKRLRSEAEARAMFDPSPEAASVRKYEAAAVRTFLRTLKELQKIQQKDEAQSRREEEAEAMAELVAMDTLGSFSPDEMTNALSLEKDMPTPRKPLADDFLARGGRFDVPISVGRRR